MATQRGVGVIFGTGITGTAGIVWDEATAANKKAYNQSEDFAREADTAEIRNKDGDVVGKVYYNLRKTLNLTVIPADFDATPEKAEAITNADAFLVAPGEIVTLADANSTVVDGGSNGSKWLLETCSRRTTNTGEAVIDITLIQYDDNDVAVAVS